MFSVFDPVLLRRFRKVTAAFHQSFPPVVDLTRPLLLRQHASNEQQPRFSPRRRTIVAQQAITPCN